LKKIPMWRRNTLYMLVISNTSPLAVAENKKSTANKAAAPVGATMMNSKKVLVNTMVITEVNGEESSEEEETSDEGPSS
jgi:hypothetical protein